MPAVKCKDQIEMRWKMPHVPHGTLVTQRESGCFIFAKPDLFCAENNQSPAQTPKGQFLWKKGRGGRNTFHMITAAVSVIPHLCFAIPSANHKGANFRETLHQQQPAF